MESNNKNEAINDNILKNRKLYINLLTENKIHQPEKFCGNKIKTTRFTL